MADGGGPDAITAGAIGAITGTGAGAGGATATISFLTTLGMTTGFITGLGSMTCLGLIAATGFTGFFTGDRAGCINGLATGFGVTVCTGGLNEPLLCCTAF